MALVRHPNLQNVNGKYAEGATVTAITNRDTEAAADAYEDEGGVTPVSYPVASGAEGELDIWVPVGSYETEFGDDTIDTPAVWEAISGEEIADMLTVDDIAGFPDYVFSPLTYGGDPTGSADSTEAIQAAIDAADAVNGTVHFGNGTSTWKFSEPLIGASFCRWTSAGGGAGGGNAGARLLYTGGGSEHAIQFHDKVNFEIDHLRFHYDNLTFSGAFINMENVGSGTDPANWHISHCEFNKAFTSGTPEICRAYIRLHECITGEIDNCHFNYAKNLICMGDPLTGGYCNGVHIRRCSFNDSPNLDVPIGNTYNGGQIVIGATDMNACTITNNIFSGGGPSGYVAIRGGNAGTGHDHEDFGDVWTNGITGLIISGNYMSDGSGGSGTPALIDGLNARINQRPIVIFGNMFLSSAVRLVRAGTGTADSGSAYEPTFFFFGNAGFPTTYHFGTMTAAPADYRVFALGDGFLFAPGEEPERFQSQAPLQNKMVGSLEIAFDSGFDDLDFTEERGVINIGTSIPNSGGGTGGANIGTSPDIWVYRKVAGSGHRLTLQGPTDGGDTNDGVQIVAGSGVPTERFYANNTGIAFNGQTPAARPDYTVSNPSTDRALDVSGDTTAQVAAVLGTLIADLIAIGLLQ